LTVPWPLTSERQDATTAAIEKMDFIVVVLVKYRERLRSLGKEMP